MLNVLQMVYINIVMNEKLRILRDEILKERLGIVLFEKRVSLVKQVVVLEPIMQIHILCV